MFTFQGLQQGFTLQTLAADQAVYVSPPGIGDPALDVDLGPGQEAQQATKGLVRTSSEGKGDNLTTEGILDPPQRRTVIASADGP